MKDPRLIALVVAALVLGSLLYAEKQNGAALQAKLEAAWQDAQERKTRDEAQARDLQRQIGDLKAVIAQFEARRRTASSGGEAPAGGVVEEGGAGAVAGAAADKPKGGISRFLEKMFTDPQMKKMMRAQQGMGIQMMYKDLAKELGLTPEEAKRVNELLTERQMARAGSGFQAMSADGAEPGPDTAAEYDRQLEDLLGKERYGRLNDYERSIGDRMQLSQYKQAFQASGMELSDRQSQGLLEVMKAERAKTPLSPLDPASGNVAAAMEAMQSEQGVEELMRSQEDLNRRVLSQARNVLNPDQMVQFQQIQQQQLEMQKMGMRMGRAMFGAGGK